jgi:hypothetical protein
MISYEDSARQELRIWQVEMQRKPSFTDRVSKSVQDRINRVIPDKAHRIITTTIRKMVEGVLFGAQYATATPMHDVPLAFRDSRLEERISFYRGTAAAEGAVTGAGGILLNFADFPLLVGLKLKFLFDAAAIYGFDARDYRERLYLLYVFQLAFSSRKRRREVFEIIRDWDNYTRALPEASGEFYWRTFQQEYRDYIDLAKLAQLIPFIGAAVGAVANYKLLNQLGQTAKFAYRMRILGEATR